MKTSITRHTFLEQDIKYLPIFFFKAEIHKKLYSKTRSSGRILQDLKNVSNMSTKKLSKFSHFDVKMSSYDTGCRNWNYLHIFREFFSKLVVWRNLITLVRLLLITLFTNVFENILSLSKVVASRLKIHIGLKSEKKCNFLKPHYFPQS